VPGQLEIRSWLRGSEPPGPDTELLAVIQATAEQELRKVDEPVTG